MKHKTKIILIVALLVVFVTACKNSNESNETSSTTSSVEEKKENPILPRFKDGELTTLNSTTKIVSYEIKKDKDGDIGLLFLSEFTNQDDEEISPVFDWLLFQFSQKVNEEEVILEEQAVISDEIAGDSKYSQTLGNMASHVEPGKTVEFIYFLKLENSNPVTITAQTSSDKYVFGEETLVID